VATEKTKAMLVKGNLHYGRMSRIFIHGKKIDFVDEHRYLGIYIDKKLSFIPHVQHLRDRINGISDKKDLRRMGLKTQSIPNAL